MKAAKFLLLLFVIVAFASCENHMDIRDEIEGTPTNADSVLPAKLHHTWTEEEIEAHKASLPRVYWR